MKSLEKTVYLVVWVDSASEIKARLLSPRFNEAPTLAGGEIAYKIQLKLNVPDHSEVRDLSVPPVTIMQGEISAQVLEVRKK